jgi:hypothetical protein
MRKPAMNKANWRIESDPMFLLSIFLLQKLINDDRGYDLRRHRDQNLYENFFVSHVSGLYAHFFHPPFQGFQFRLYYLLCLLETAA